MARLSDYLKEKMSFRYKNDYIHIPIFLWIIVGLTFLVLICLHSYNDILITAKQGYHFWDLLFEGRPMDFYLDAQMTTGNDYYTVEQGAAYLFPVYLVFAVWNFPTWIISRIVGVELFNTIPSMIWMKLIVVPFVLLSAKCIFNIIKKTKDKKEYAVLGAFLFVSSILVIIPTALIGQYDIITAYLILLGLDGWLSNNQKKFIFSFAVAVLFKYFALLYFLPLLLLGEKKIHRILLSLIGIAFPALLFIVIFPKPKGQGSIVFSLIGRFFQGLNSTNQVYLYIFPIAASLVLIACFFTHINDDNKLQYAVYYIFLIMASFCILIDPLPYWVVLAAPIFILIGFTSNNRNKTLILETLMGLGIAVKNYALFYWCFGEKTTGAMGVLHRLLGKQAPDPESNNSLLLMYSYDKHFLSVVFSALVVIFLLMIWFSRPKAKEEKLLEPFNMGAVYVRTALNVIVALLPTLYLAAYTILRG